MALKKSSVKEQQANTLQFNPLIIKSWLQAAFALVGASLQAAKVTLYTERSEIKADETVEHFNGVAFLMELNS